jgi:hypothetical protein
VLIKGIRSIFHLSEYLRDLIRKDMADQGVLSHVLKGLDDIKKSRFSDKSILDILDED